MATWNGPTGFRFRWSRRISYSVGSIILMTCSGIGPCHYGSVLNPNVSWLRTERSAKNGCMIHHPNSFDLFCVPSLWLYQLRLCNCIMRPQWVFVLRRNGRSLFLLGDSSCSMTPRIRVDSRVSALCDLSIVLFPPSWKLMLFTRVMLLVNWSCYILEIATCLTNAQFVLSILRHWLLFECLSNIFTLWLLGI